jgi:prepilin-type N-terminal cleavage/methylation domain-containing protein
MRSRRGLTLMELIVASTIASILAAAAVSAMRTLVNGRHRSRLREEAVQRVYAVTQMVARDVANSIRDQQLAMCLRHPTSVMSC